MVILFLSMCLGSRVSLILRDFEKVELGYEPPLKFLPLGVRKSCLKFENDRTIFTRASKG